MSGDGKTLVTGEADLKMLLKMLEKAKKSIRAIWVQLGQCSENMLSINGLDPRQDGPTRPIRVGFRSGNDAVWQQPTSQIIRTPALYDYYSYNYDGAPHNPAPFYYQY
ncbi:unnamed protein product [Cuscuta campestris]|uniref:Uncharacterized protein n=1 Tax=Cuscuta campestris TaxID=132261 RepID=A0A484MS80_9ASTE|nr:unnamed protein product [Cuscuta campestris]